MPAQSKPWRPASSNNYECVIIIIRTGCVNASNSGGNDFVIACIGWGHASSDQLCLVHLRLSSLSSLRMMLCCVCFGFFPRANIYEKCAHQVSTVLVAILSETCRHPYDRDGAYTSITRCIQKYSRYDTNISKQAETCWSLILN